MSRLLAWATGQNCHVLRQKTVQETALGGVKVERGGQGFNFVLNLRYPTEGVKQLVKGRESHWSYKLGSGHHIDDILSHEPAENHKGA